MSNNFTEQTPNIANPAAVAIADGFVAGRFIESAELLALAQSLFVRNARRLVDSAVALIFTKYKPYGVNAFAFDVYKEGVADIAVQLSVDPSLVLVDPNSTPQDLPEAARFDAAHDLAELLKKFVGIEMFLLFGIDVTVTITPEGIDVEPHDLPENVLANEEGGDVQTKY